jgi:predicted nucleotidyltransferase
MRFGLSEEILNDIIKAIRESQSIKKAVIFGSRARGDFRYNSDIDIALYADSEPRAGLFLDVDDAAGIYKTNIIVVTDTLDEKLRSNIERDGVDIYDYQILPR